MRKGILDLHSNILDISSLVPDFIRYPPAASIPNALVNKPKLMKKLSSENMAITPMLQDFTEMYQQMAASLFSMSTSKLIPPGHPIYSKESSITLLKEENQKIMKENLELQKQLENKKESKRI
jgi:hypothetical protein|tara:strand:+ start:132 stop:500 length:369 start_codon:yes stop_codon:yes gene_type:complete